MVCLISPDDTGSHQSSRFVQTRSQGGREVRNVEKNLKLIRIEIPSFNTTNRMFLLIKWISHSHNPDLWSVDLVIVFY